MLDARHVAEHLAEVQKQLARRSPEDAASLDAVADIAKRRRELIVVTEGLQAQRNQASVATAGLAKSGDKAALEARRAELKKLSDEVKRLETELREVEAEMEEKLLESCSTAPSCSGCCCDPADDGPTSRSWRST
jgi:seryl-tRNA synthetase